MRICVVMDKAWRLCVLSLYLGWLCDTLVSFWFIQELSPPSAQGLLSKSPVWTPLSCKGVLGACCHQASLVGSYIPAGIPRKLDGSVSCHILDHISHSHRQLVRPCETGVGMEPVEGFCPLEEFCDGGKQHRIEGKMGSRASEGT